MDDRRVTFVTWVWAQLHKHNLNYQLGCDVVAKVKKDGIKEHLSGPCIQLTSAGAGGIVGAT